MAPNQYVEYLVEFGYTAKTLEGSKVWVSTSIGGIRGEIGVNTFRNAIRANYSNEYVTSHSLIIVRPWFSSIGYNEEIGAIGTLKKSRLPPRWRLLMAQIIQCLEGCDALADSTAKVDLGISAPNDFIPKQDQTKSAGDGLKTAYTDLDKGVPLASKSNDSSAEGEKNTYSATIEANLKKYLVDLTGIDVMEEYYKKKLLYDK
nr:hypothetical protein [Tanacetum cinerariifolium]